MKVKLEVEVSATIYNKYKLKKVLLEKLYNICDQWVNEEVPPLLTFVIEKKDELTKKDIN